jgi:DNA-binding MurR/RpiR family transcriptional regulator
MRVLAFRKRLHYLIIRGGSGMKNLEECIAIYYTKMTKTDKQIFEKILAGAKEFSVLPIHEVAYRLQVSSPTVLRAVKKIGYSGYPEFRLSLKEYLSKEDEKEQKSEKPQPENLVNSIIGTYERFLNLLKSVDLEKDILQIVSWMKRAKDVKAIGIGNSALPAQQLIYSLYSQGKFFEAITTKTQIYYLKQALDPETVYFIYSVSGLNEYQELMDAAKKKKIKTVLVTMTKDTRVSMSAYKTVLLPTAITFMRKDGSLRQIDVRFGLFLFSEIISYYYNFESDKAEKKRIKKVSEIAQK